MGNESTSLMSIREKYKAGAHLLLPTIFEERLSPFYQLQALEVSADLSAEGGDIFKVGGQFVKTGKRIKGDDGKTKDEEAWTEFFSPAKPLLMKIATAAGIQFNPNFTGVVPTGKNTYHGKAQGAIKLPDGTYKTHYDEKLINLDDEEDKFRLEFMDKSIEGITGKAATEAAKLFKGKWTSVEKKYGRPGETEKAYTIDDADRQKFIDRSVLANMILKRKNAPQLAITGAILRVIRALIGMKGQYTREELQKPFVLARVVFSPDYNDPEVRKAMLMQGMTSMSNIFGNMPQIAAPQVFSEVPAESMAIDTANIENDPFISESNQAVKDTPTPDDDEQLPWEQEETGFSHDHMQEEEFNPNTCQGCGASISDKVAEFSMKKYKRPLCMTCQKGA